MEGQRRHHTAFQFLIGRLGTLEVGQYNPRGVEFQFLIGRLGTYIDVLVSILDAGFNSS